jgi:hypothetical protein
LVGGVYWTRLRKYDILTGLSGGIPLMFLDFAQHIPGQPYELTLIQFFNFLGLELRFKKFRRSRGEIIKKDLLTILPKYRRVRIMTECQPWWCYKTKSKTVFQIQIINKKMKFFVIIPANRDREGKKHYIRLRIGEPYNGAVFKR